MMAGVFNYFLAILSVTSIMVVTEVRPVPGEPKI